MRVPIVLSSRVREYFIILGGIARVERGVPELETVFCPRHHSRLSEESEEAATAPGDVPKDTRSHSYRANRNLGQPRATDFRTA
jgi:hypothetical protein